MKNWSLLVLSILIVSGYIADVYLVLSGKITTGDAAQQLMYGQALGGLQGMAMMVASYYFGTTKGSEEKTTAVSDMVAKLPMQPSVKTTTTVATPIKE